MITGKIENNKFIPDHVELFRNEFRKRNGKEVRIEVRTIGSKNKQYHFLYGIIYPAFMEFGYIDVNEIDLALKSLFLLGQDENKMTGEIFTYIKRKRDCTQEEIRIYIDKCITYGNTEHNLNIPESSNFFNN